MKEPLNKQHRKYKGEKNEKQRKFNYIHEVGNCKWKFLNIDFKNIFILYRKWMHRKQFLK